MQKALDKVQCFAAAQAVAWLAQVQPDFWGDSQAESFLENVAVKTRPVESDQTRCLSLGMRRGKGCRQGLETPENLVTLRAVGADVPPHPILHVSL